MLPRPQRLHRKKDYLILGTRGRSIHGQFATLRFRALSGGGTKVGFLTSTKVWKLAVDRNRIKRRFREAARVIWKDFPQNVHLLYILKPPGKEAPFSDIQEEMRRLAKRIPEALKEPARMSPRAKKMQEKRKQRRSLTQV